MKIETEFDRKLRRIYDLLALSYPPRTLQSTDDPDDVEIEEVLIEIKPFNPKIQSYDIDHDSLTNHRATKQLSKFVEEAERKRREIEEPPMHEVEENYLLYKQKVVSFINDLAKKTKEDNARSMSFKKIQPKNQKEAILGDLVKKLSVSNEISGGKDMQVSGNIDEEQDDGEVAEALNEVEDVPRNLSSEEFVSIQGSEDNAIQRGTIVTKKLRQMVEQSIDINVDPKIAKSIKEKMAAGAYTGKIPRRESKTSQQDITKASDMVRKRSNVQKDLIKKTAARQIAQKRSIAENKQKMNAVLNNVKRQVELSNKVKESRKYQGITDPSKRTLQKVSDKKRSLVATGKQLKKVTIDAGPTSSGHNIRDEDGFVIPQVSRKVRKDTGYPSSASSRTPSPRDLKPKYSKEDLRKKGPGWRF